MSRHGFGWRLDAKMCQALCLSESKWVTRKSSCVWRLHLARSTGPTNFAMQPVLDPEPILRYGCTMSWRMPLLCYGSATWGVILQSQLRGCLPMCHLQPRCSGPRPSSWNLPRSFSRWPRAQLLHSADRSREVGKSRKQEKHAEALNRSE